VISLGPKEVPYQVTSPLSTKYTLPQLFYFLCCMSYKHGQKQVPKTMDQLKCLSIPSEMLRFFNHACYPRLGHPTRLVHLTPHDIHYTRHMNVAQSKCQRPWKVSALSPPRTYINIQCMNVAQSKCQKPWKVSALSPPRTYTTSNV